MVLSDREEPFRPGRPLTAKRLKVCGIGLISEPLQRHRPSCAAGVKSLGTLLSLMLNRPLLTFQFIFDHMEVKWTAFIQRFLSSGHSKCFTIIAWHPPIHTRMYSPTACRATASSSGAVGVRCLAQGHLNKQLGGEGDRASYRPVTSQPALPPMLLPPS